MLKKKSSQPLYQQIAETLASGIHSGQYQPGDKLPSEYELCQMYSVSRMTVRLALGQLIQQGLIYSVHGKGSFVNQPILRYDTRKIVGFSETLRQRGLEGHTVIANCEVTKEESVFPGKCVNLDLVGYAGEQPFVFYRSYLLPDLGQQMKEAAEQAVKEGRPFSTYELYEYMDRKPVRVEQEITATDADASLAAVLKISKGKAVLVAVSCYYDADGSLLEYKKAYYRSDICAFRLQREV